MNPLEQKIASLEEKIDVMQVTVQKLYTSFVWTLIITIAMFVLPLIGIAILIPKFISTYTQTLGQF